jgi:hypothetical protein
MPNGGRQERALKGGTAEMERKHFRFNLELRGGAGGAVHKDSASKRIPNNRKTMNCVITD